jgi:hypothetical protein
MNWIQIASAIAMAAMIIYLFPRARHAIENSPRGSLQDWMGYVVPMVAVVLFIVLLIALM